jgi:hypothetical protein
MTRAANNIEADDPCQVYTLNSPYGFKKQAGFYRTLRRVFTAKAGKPRQRRVNLRVLVGKTRNSISLKISDYSDLKNLLEGISKIRITSEG